MAQFTSVDEIIQDLLIEEGKSSEHEYLRYFNIALNGLKELNFDTVRQIKVIQLEVDHKNTVSLPTDYIAYISIAVSNGDELNYLGTKNRMNFAKNPGQSNQESTDEDPPVFTDYNPGEGLWGRYGQGGGNNSNGYYRENLQDGTIEFSGSGSTIVLEYISDGSADLEGEEIKIHSFAQEALKSYIYWKSIHRKRAINMNEKLLAKKDYYNQKRLARARMQSFNKQEAMQTTRKAFKQAPKI